MIRQASTAVVLGLFGAALAGQEPASYSREIAPILRQRCAGCHHAGKPKGGLDLSTHRALMKGGRSGPAVVAGDPDVSPLLALVRGPEPEMPKQGAALSAEQIALLELWIAEGATDDAPPAAAVPEPSAPAVYRTRPQNPALAYSPDGTLLAVSGYHEVLLHDGSGHGLVARLPGPAPRIESLAFSKSGRWLAACGGAPGRFGSVQVWDVAERRLAHAYRVTGDTLFGVSISPDEQTLAFGCADRTVRRLRIADGTELLRFKNHADWVLGTCFTRDGKRLVSAGRDKAIKIIDLADGRFVDDINNPIEKCLSFARHPSSDTIVYGGDLGTARVYRISDNQKRTAARRDTNLVRAFANQGGAVHAVAFSSDGALVASGGVRGVIRVFETKTGKELARLMGAAGALFDVAFRPGTDEVAACGYDGSVRIWNGRSGKLLRAFSAVPVASSASADAPEAPFLTAVDTIPAALALDGARDERRILVTGRTRDGKRVDLTAGARIEAASPHVAVTDEGSIAPRAAGRGAVRVFAGGLMARVPVHVRSAARRPVHFAKDVMPVLARAGCNAGTCHGAQAGQNGFMLSLRGFDPKGDYGALVHDLGGRRIDRVDPKRSLMLQKPTAAVPHEGGTVLERGSRHYALLHDWIREGTGYASDSASRVARLEVLPGAVLLDLPGHRQHLLVIAHYADTSSRDVTRDAILSSSDTEIARVTGTEVEGLRRGEAAVLVRYEGAYVAAPITVMGDRSGFAWRRSDPYNFIDEHVDAKLRRIKTLRSDLCTDAEFVRRLYLDLTGKPPEPAVAEAFCREAGPSRAKRAALVERLLDSAAFVEHWANKWADLLQCNSRTLGAKGVWVFREWLARQIAENRPYDEFVRALLTASGGTFDAPAANYMRALSDRGRTPDTGKMTEDVTQTFLGIRFNCNKCHNHPFERWTQDQYYEFAAHFARVRLKPGQRAGEMVVYDSYDGGETKHARTAVVVAPEVPFAAAVAGESDTRRGRLAGWLTARENPLFARSYVNRVWSYFFGRGIIEPVDDIRAGNPPSNPELLAALERSFIASGFDFRALVTAICSSRTYQTSFRANEWNADDRVNFARFVPRRLAAEQLYDAVAVATGVRPQLAGLPAGSRPVEVPDGRVEGDDFLALFGRPKRDSACECARTSNISLSHALNLVGGKTIHDAVVSPEGRAAKLAGNVADDREIVRRLYWAALCRAPTSSEIATFADFGRGAERAAAVQDLLWALLNSPAFLFNR